MRILYGVHHFPPNYTGGAEWRAHRTATAMQRKGHSVSIVCIERITFGSPNKVEVQNDYFGDLLVYRLNVQLDIRPDRLGYHYQNQELGDTISHLLEGFKADLFHVIGGYLLTASALQSARVMQIPSIVSLTDFWYLCPRIQMIRSDGSLSTFPIQYWRCARCLGEERRRYRWLGKVIPRLMDYYWKHRFQSIKDIQHRMELLVNELNQTGLIISPSNFVRQSYINLGVESQRIVYTRQGVDLSTFPDVLPKKQPSGILRIGYIGQIVEIKGVDILIRAVNRLVGLPVHLSIYGDLTNNPVYVERLRSIIRDNRQIEFKGSFNREQLLEVMRGLDVIVVPSLWYENSPNVIQEAFATKTPIITSDLGGMAELINHRENGLLFRTGDAEDLEKQLKLLVEERDLIDRLKNGIRAVKSVETEMDELERIYLRMTGKDKPGAHRH